jgi:UDP:flavonoid glycosyltransferase YjiC (YdhE family)
MKLGLIFPNLPGPLNLMTALARQLQTRNHDVVFLYAEAGAAGLPIISADEKGAIRTRNSRIPEFRVIC